MNVWYSLPPNTVRDNVWYNLRRNVRDNVWRNAQCIVWTTVLDSMWFNAQCNVGHNVWDKL